MALTMKKLEIAPVPKIECFRFFTAYGLDYDGF